MVILALLSRAFGDLLILPLGVKQYQVLGTCDKFGYHKQFSLHFINAGLMTILIVSWIFLTWIQEIFILIFHFSRTCFLGKLDGRVGCTDQGKMNKPNEPTKLDGGHMSWPAKLAERTKLARQAANDSNNTWATSSNALEGKIYSFHCIEKCKRKKNSSINHKGKSSVEKFNLPHSMTQKIDKHQQWE